MFRAWLALAAVVCGLARAQAPAYSANSIVNGASYATASYAPNSIVTIFGSNLARATATATPDMVRAGKMPTQLAYISVYVDNTPTGLFYVSDSQINFLVPSDEIAGDAKIRVVREGVTGPEVTITLTDVAPALFPMTGGYIIAAHADGSLITADAPAHSGETIVIYAAGLGHTQPNPGNGEIPAYAGAITHMKDLIVTLAGAAVDPMLIKYAGIAPGFAGLYQVNLTLPNGLSADPEIRLFMGAQSTAVGLKLPVQ